MTYDMKDALIVFVVLSVTYLLMSLLVMIVWNNGIKPAFNDDALKKISYPHALAMTVFLMIISGTPIIMVQSPIQKAMAFR